MTTDLKVFHYGEKGWFKYVTRLNGDGLIPGNTLTELHVSKEECREMFTFGGVQSNNGYKTTNCSFFNDRVQWLWVRIHQQDGPINNDFGIAFAQGLLYEYKTNEEVDWAEFASRTVNRFSRSRGVNQVHPLWAWAHPHVVIDVITGLPTQKDYCFPNTPGSRPIRSSLSTHVPVFRHTHYLFLYSLFV